MSSCFLGGRIISAGIIRHALVAPDLDATTTDTPTGPEARFLVVGVPTPPLAERAYGWLLQRHHDAAATTPQAVVVLPAAIARAPAVGTRHRLDANQALAQPGHDRSLTVREVSIFAKLICHQDHLARC